MAISDFTFNPCRRNIFDVYPIDKSETDLKAINEARQKAREEWKFGQPVARDGAALKLSEAELNAMEKVLLDPLERLKTEQFVHQAHRFTQDEQFARCLRQLETRADPMPELLSGLQEAVLAVLSRFLPPLAPRELADDLEWPPPPEPCELRRESLTTAILRDR